MKKRMAMMLFAATLLLTLTACQPAAQVDTPAPAGETTAATVDSTQETTAPVDTTTTAPTTTTTETTTTTAPAEDPKEPYVFTCDELHFTLTMPASWEGAFAHRHDGNVVSFYELTNHQYDSQGKLFTIRFMAKEIDIDFPDFDIIGTYGDYNVIVMYPTDVQFNYEDETMTQNYLKMQDEIDEVIATFVYNG